MRIYRVVTKKDGKLEKQDFKDLASLGRAYEQVGVEEDSYSIRLHGEPVFKGLIGPMSEGKSVIRYETPEVFAEQTEEWSKKTARRGRDDED